MTFFVAAGTLNVNTNTPVLSPVGLIGLGAGLAGLALYRLRRTRAGPLREG